MKYRIYGFLAVGFGALLSATPLSAHHEIAAKFDDKKPVTIKGTVTKLDWANPHAHVFINVQNGTALANWAVELESPVDLAKGGWSRESVKPGDELTWDYGKEYVDEHVKPFGCRCVKHRPTCTSPGGRMGA